MSAPAVSQAPRVLLRALPEYEPSRRTGPPGPAAAAAPLPPIAAPAPPRPPGMPTWAESGRTRARLALLVGLILEAVDGRRPLDQVRDLVVPAVYASLCTRRRQVLGRRHRLRSLHTCRPRPDTVELCATVAISQGQRPPRYAAFVARFVDEGPTGLRCTVFRQLHHSGPR
jgi:hypothetical protein